MRGISSSHRAAIRVRMPENMSKRGAAETTAHAPLNLIEGSECCAKDSNSKTDLFFALCFCFSFDAVIATCCTDKCPNLEEFRLRIVNINELRFRRNGSAIRLTAFDEFRSLGSAQKERGEHKLVDSESKCYDAGSCARQTDEFQFALPNLCTPRCSRRSRTDFSCHISFSSARRATDGGRRKMRSEPQPLAANFRRRDKRATPHLEPNAFYAKRSSPPRALTVC